MFASSISPESAEILACLGAGIMIFLPTSRWHALDKLFDQYAAELLDAFETGRLGAKAECIVSASAASMDRRPIA